MVFIDFSLDIKYKIGGDGYSVYNWPVTTCMEKWLFTWLSLVMYLMVSYFVQSFFPRDVLDEIWD